MSSKGRPYRTVDLDGWEVLVGKGAVENDVLTFQIAEKTDLWLHVAGGVPGSHVVIRQAGSVSAPREVVERAAQLAAWYSKSRAARRVEVHVCRVSDVSKPRGAKPGLVQIRRFDRLFVTPTPIEPHGSTPAS